MRQITSDSTMQVLRELFARYGLPMTIVSDNGPQFVSDSFKCFLKQNGIKQMFSPPYMPSCNGQAERYVQSIKNMLKKQDKNLSKNHRLFNVLFNYRNTPHAVTGMTLDQLFLL